MSQDILADNLNEIMNAKRAGKDEAVIAKTNKLFLKILEMMKKEKYVNYKIDKEQRITIEIGKISEVRAIKPRFNVSSAEIEKYMRRFLPARDYGFLVISTSLGLMTHKEAIEKNTGGCLIAYFF